MDTKNIKFPELKHRQKLTLIIVAIAAVVLLAGGLTFRFAIYPSMRASSLLDSVSGLTDFDYTYSYTHEDQRGTAGWRLNGTYLESARQASAYLTKVTDGETSEGVQIYVDGDTMYANTRDFFRVTGPYWLGDANGDEYFTEVYDGIFDTEVTSIDMEVYGCRIWDNEPQWMVQLKEISSILFTEIIDALPGTIRYAENNDSYSATISTKDLVNALRTWTESQRINCVNYYDDLATAILSYGVEVGQYSGSFGQTMRAWTEKLSSAMTAKTEDEQRAAFAGMFSKLDAIITECEANGGTLTHAASQSNSNIVETYTLDTGLQTYTFSRELRPSFHTAIEDIPTEAESFPVQVALLENAYGRIFNTDPEVIATIVASDETNAGGTTASQGESVESADVAGSASSSTNSGTMASKTDSKERGTSSSRFSGSSDWTELDADAGAGEPASSGSDASRGR